LQRGLQRYRRHHHHALHGHAAMIHDYAAGRKLNTFERMLFSCAARDERLTLTFIAMATRNIAPTRALAASLPRVAMITARESITRYVGDQSVARDHLDGPQPNSLDRLTGRLARLPTGRDKGGSPVRSRAARRTVDRRVRGPSLSPR
jgi:hypothetical protein